jgi:hypothetical protein
MKQETAQILGIVALGCAVVSWFICMPLLPIFAIAAIVLAVMAMRGGASRKLNIATIVLASIALLISTVAEVTFSLKAERFAHELERIGRKLIEECWACGGKGYVDCVFCVRGYLSDGSLCPFCNGRGVTICTICNGTGKPQ